MDSSNWRSNQGGGGAIRESTMHSGDWRSLLHRSSRQRMINRIMVALKRHLPFSGQEGLQELRKIAVRFEEKIYTSSTSRSDYLRTMSLKMQTMETRSPNPIPNAMQSYYGANIVNPFNQDSRAQMGNWTRSQGGSGSGDGHWRSELQADSRQRIVNKITDTFKRHIPFSGREGLLELNKIAERFEEKIYSAATSQSDYLRKISLEMLTLEARSQNSMQLNSGASYSLNPSDPGSSSLSYALPPPQSGQNSSLQEAFSPLLDFGSQMGNWTCSGSSGDWRSHLQPDSRQRIVNKIMDTLKRHLPFSGQEGLQELNKIAVRFEENIYTCATSQSDYLRKISLKMLTMETRSQNPIQSNSGANYIANPSDPGNHHDE